jgi:flagellin
MIGGISYASSQIASAYNSSSQQLADTLTRIASGKKFQSASEDMLGFIRSQNLQSDISGYDDVKQNLTEFKTFTSAAVDAASTIYEKMSKMKTLATNYAAAVTAADTDKQAEYKSEFDALKTEVGSILTNSRVDGVNVTTSGSALKTVSLDPQGTGSLAMNFTTNTTSGGVTGFDITAGTIGATIQTEIGKVLSYMSEAKAFDGITDQQLKLTGTIINSKQAVSSMITDIDDAEETSKAIDQQIRQQAAVSMMAQANVSRQAVMKLYS